MKKWRKSMKLMKLFLTSVFALSVLAPSTAVIAMEPAQRPTGPAIAAEIAQAQTCAICQGDLTEGQKLRTLRCNQNGVPHIFCHTCINDWLVSRQRDNQPALCPICQTPAVPEFTLREQVITNLKFIEKAHNPLNQNNRGYLIRTTAGVALRNTIAPLLAGLIFKYYHKYNVEWDLNPKSLATFINLSEALIEYAILKYFRGGVPLNVANKLLVGAHSVVALAFLTNIFIHKKS